LDGTVGRKVVIDLRKMARERTVGKIWQRIVMEI